MGQRHPFVAAIYDRCLAGEERAYLAALREELLSGARGVVVEVGAGTGLNFPHYRAGQVHTVEAVEPDPHMRRRSEWRARQAAVPVQLHDGTAENLPFAAGHADTVVATLVVCSVDDPQRAIRELRRVLKPDGVLLFIEHVHSEQGLRAHIQNWVTPVWRRIAANCHVNRASVQLLQQAGFDVQETCPVVGRGPWGNRIVAGSAHVATAPSAP